MKSVIFSIVFSSFSIGLFAQANFTEKFVIELFDKPQKIQWIRYYQGRMDDLNDVSMTLAYDGKYCKGQMVYLSSKERFRLDGTLKDNKLRLKEINHAAAVSGQLEGKMASGSLVLDWSNYDHSLGGTLELKEVPQEVFTTSYCGDNKWFRIYQGIIFGSPVELILQKDSKTGLRGTAWFEKDGLSYQLKGDIVADKQFKIALQDDYNQLKGTLEGHLKHENQLSASFYKADGQRCPTLFSLEEQLDMGCKEYADYMSGYDIIYPQTRSNQFNYWMEGLCKEWTKSCEEYSGAIKARNSKADPKLRASVRSYAWSDITLYNDHLISGFLTFSNAWDITLQEQPFTYDFKKGREITLQDIFKDNFVDKKFLKKYLDQNITAHELYKDYDFRYWLARQEFSLFTLKKEGIAFSTPFDMVYGKQQITIPYEDLKPFLKEDNPLKHLLK